MLPLVLLLQVQVRLLQLFEGRTQLPVLFQEAVQPHSLLPQLLQQGLLSAQVREVLLVLLLQKREHSI
jgi:hypothetical protein